MVVGGGLGMGEATALRLAAAGCRVAVTDIDLARAEAVAGRICASGGEAIAAAHDILRTETAGDVVREIEAALGPIDVMASIVGQASWGGVLDLDPATWDCDHQVNLRGFFFIAQAVARSMASGGRPGAITAVASVSGLQSAPGHAAYGAAKAGLVNLVRSMGVELAVANIRVNAVAPGTIDTPRIAEGRDAAAWEDRIRNSLIPARRLGQVREIADAILFLSSKLASYVTGQTLAVDGGFTAQFLLGAPR